MYYILNETNHIVAADDILLSLCGASHIDELSSSLAREDTSFELDLAGVLKLNTKTGTKSYTTDTTVLSSLLGKLKLVSVHSSNTEDADTQTPTLNSSLVPTPKPTKDTAIEEPLDILDEDESNLIDSILSEEVSKEEELKEDILDDAPIMPELELDEVLEINEKSETLDILSDETENKDDEITLGDLLTLEEPEEMEEPTESIKPIEIEEDDTALFDLLSDDNKEKTEEKIEETISLPQKEQEPLLTLDDEALFLDTADVDTSRPVDVSEIVINIDEVSQNIGISSDDYSNFLDEFIDTALEHEKDLQSEDESKHSEAVNTLSYLSNVLHLPEIGDILNHINTASPKSKRGLVESFYGTLSRITTSHSDTPKNATLTDSLYAEEPVKKEEELDIFAEPDTKEEELDLFAEPKVKEEKLEIPTEAEITEEPLELFAKPEEKEEPKLPASIQPEKAKSENSFGTIDLSDIKAKHFDFQLEEAANDLSLPVELIEEFVHDFIDQAHIETKKMLEAYEDGDLDAIQKIGHLLKGASSNLRINTLSDTLYKIQFCEDSNNLEMLIKDYWAHFLSFENQINVISN